jgi:hypothetical protein
MSNPIASRRLSPSLRRAVLTVHIIASVALLGDVAVIVAINVRSATTSDPALAASAYELLTMFPVLFGIRSASRRSPPGWRSASARSGACCATAGSPPSCC